MKHFFRSGLVAGLLLGTALTAHAQTTFGPKVGVNISTAQFDVKDAELEPEDVKWETGPAGGIMLNFQFGNLSFQPALMYSQKGFTATFSEEIKDDSTGIVLGSFESTSRARLGYFEIPLNLVFTTGGDNGFQVYAGPYVAFGIEGKMKNTESVSLFGFTGDTTYTQEISYRKQEGEEGNTVYFRPIDLGVSGGLGFLVKNFQIQAGAQYGFSNMITRTLENKDPEDKVNNLTVQATIGYLFGR